MPVQLSLHNGSQGYIGASDTWLDQWNPSTVYGNATTLNLRPGGVRRALVRFDLADLLPDNVDVTAASLKFYAEGDGPDMSVNLYRMLRPWDAATASYQQPGAGQPWGVAGGQAGSDWDATPSATLTLAGGAGARTVNVLNLVRGWLADPGNNFGVLLNVESASYIGGRLLESSEYFDTNLRPSLELIYRPSAGTPTATPTPTATTTPTTHAQSYLYSHA